MRLMIDTNILLDVPIHRGDFYDDTKAVLTLCEERIIQGFVSASAVTDIFTSPARPSPRQHRGHYRVISSILNIVRIPDSHE